MGDTVSGVRPTSISSLPETRAYCPNQTFIPGLILDLRSSDPYENRLYPQSDES